MLTEEKAEARQHKPYAITNGSNSINTIPKRASASVHKLLALWGNTKEWETKERGQESSGREIRTSSSLSVQVQDGVPNANGNIIITMAREVSVPGAKSTREPCCRQGVRTKKKKQTNINQTQEGIRQKDSRQGRTEGRKRRRDKKA
jgi:hypothetical protein